MLMVISYFSLISQFAIHKTIVSFHGSTVSENSEIREIRRGMSKQIQRRVSLNSLFSQFAALQDSVGTVVHHHSFDGQFCLPSSGTISESQHTRCAHRALPELACGSAPSTPERQKP